MRVCQHSGQFSYEVHTTTPGTDGETIERRSMCISCAFEVSLRINGVLRRVTNA